MLDVLCTMTIGDQNRIRGIDNYQIFDAHSTDDAMFTLNIAIVDIIPDCPLAIFGE